MNTTADIANRIVTQADDAGPSRPSVPATSNAHDYPGTAADEMDALIGKDTNPTKRIAAGILTTIDPQPFVKAAGGQARRAVDEDPRRARVRERLDQQSAATSMNRRLRDIVKANPKQFRGISHTDPIDVIGKAIFERGQK